MRLTQGLFSSVGKMTKLYSNLPESYIKRAMEKVSDIKCQCCVFPTEVIMLAMLV